MPRTCCGSSPLAGTLTRSAAVAGFVSSAKSLSSGSDSCTVALLMPLMLWMFLAISPSSARW